jgi:hypothetical protein
VLNRACMRAWHLRKTTHSMSAGGQPCQFFCHTNGSARVTRFGLLKKKMVALWMFIIFPRPMLKVPATVKQQRNSMLRL